MAPVEISAGIGALIMEAALAAGVPRADLEARTGFSLGAAADPDARIPIEMETALWDEGAFRRWTGTTPAEARQRPG